MRGLALTLLVAGNLASPREGVPIIGGAAVDPGAYPEVVAIFNGTLLCSGVVVAPELVLTSAACLSEVGSADELSVFHGDSLSANPPVAVTDYGLHPAFCRTCVADIHDFGYVVTETPFAPPFAQPIVTAAERAEALALMTELTLVGYGEDPNAASGEEIGLKREVVVRVRSVSDAGLEIFAGGNGRDTCGGDAGAPAFARLSDGRTVVAAIGSRGSEPCGAGGFYGAAFVPLCWIADETGVQLPADCPTCNCDGTGSNPPGETDTDSEATGAQDDSEPGCACGSGHTRGASALLLLVGARRRRQPEVAASRQCAGR